MVTTSNQPFSYSLTTDGVSVSVHVLRNQGSSTINDWGFDYKGIYHPLDVNKRTRIVGLDPGRGSVYMAASDKTREDVLPSLGDAGWKEILGTTSSMKKSREFLASDPVVDALISNMPSSRTHVYGAYGAFLRYFLLYRDRIFGFYQQPQWQWLRQNTQIKRQKVLNITADVLSAGNSNTIIAYGGGQFCCWHDYNANKHS